MLPKLCLEHIASCISNVYDLIRFWGVCAVWRRISPNGRTLDIVREHESRRFVLHYNDATIATLVLRVMKHVYFFMRVGSTVPNLNALRGVPYVILRNCTGITAPAPLCDAKHLDLEGTDIVDVSVLGHVQRLDISHTCVRDVSALGGVRHLIAVRTHISDVSALHSADCLALDRCEHIRDVSALGNVRHLSISGCINIERGIECLTNVRVLYACKVRMPPNLAPLAKTHTLLLDQCPVPLDVTPLRTVNTLSLIGCSVVRGLDVVHTSCARVFTTGRLAYY